MTYASLKRKLFIERILMSPFVLAGRLWGWLFPLKTKHRVFLFFPNTDIGGSPKVNIDIINCVSAFSPLIIFSKRPKNGLFADRFQQTGARIIDLHQRIDNKAFHFINLFYRGVIASWIHSQPEAIVLGGECIFFYKIIPHLHKNVRKVEVCHLGTWLNYSIGFAKHIDARVFSTEQLKRNVEAQYRENRFSADAFSKLFFIENAIDISSVQQVVNSDLQVVFIGRGSPQKRVPLTAAIAKECYEKKLPVHFSFVGDVDAVINTNDFAFCTFYGNVKDSSLLERIYNESDVLIMTSSFEGLPIVVMEMMARGKIIITTAVNGLPDYIKQRVNGFLITSTGEEDIIKDGVSYIEELISNHSLKETMGEKSREIAIEKFNYAKFCEEYRNVMRLPD